MSEELKLTEQERKTLFEDIKTNDINIKRNSFQLKIGDDNATILYTKKGNTYDLYDTILPEHYRGLGLGTLFAKKIFDFLVKENAQIKLTCEFLQNVYEKNRTIYEKHVIQ